MSINDHIKQRYPHEPTDLIARDLNISIRQVYNRAYSMGLKKTDEYIRTHQPGWADLKERGRATRFKKGDTPHNKGVLNIKEEFCCIFGFLYGPKHENS